MPDFPSPPPSASQSESNGVFAGILNLFGSTGRHMQALLELAGHEAQEATGIYLRLIGFFVGALILAIFGYVFLILFLAFLIAVVFGVNWIWIALGLSVVHLLGACFCVFQVKSRLSSPVFAATREEIKKDMEALKTSK